MITLNDGILTVYDRIPGVSGGGMPVDKRGEGHLFWFQYLAIGANEYYGSKQAEVEIEKRVRILQCRKVSTQNIVVIDDKQYQVGRVVHGHDKMGIPVTDMTLERIEPVYDIT